LFLDELATLSAGAQERLLRAIEYGEVTRIGSNRPVRVDVRVVAATNVHLPDQVKTGKFRADLLDRLAFDVITLPPLRERDGDVELLADHFGRRMAAELDWSNWPGFATDTLRALEAYHWPGNIRELRNIVERAVYRWDNPHAPIAAVEIDPFTSPWQPEGAEQTHRAPAEAGAQFQADELSTQNSRLLPAQEHIIALNEPPSDLRAAVAAYERRILEAALLRARYNQREAARALNLTYDQLRHALKRVSILKP
jgi:psp operon transcriptional activator